MGRGWLRRTVNAVEEQASVFLSVQYWFDYFQKLSRNLAGSIDPIYEQFDGRDM